MKRTKGDKMKRKPLKENIESYKGQEGFLKCDKLTVILDTSVPLSS